MLCLFRYASRQARDKRQSQKNQDKNLISKSGYLETDKRLPKLAADYYIRKDDGDWKGGKQATESPMNR